MQSCDEFCLEYGRRLQEAFVSGPIPAVGRLAAALKDAMRSRSQVFLAGNGGSAANALHLANDFLYGMGKDAGGVGLRAEALAANTAVLTCLGNDIGYDEIFAQQLRVKARAGDLLIVLSGSGNSPNVVRALDVGNELGLITFAILGYSGGRCRELARVPIHFAVNDMQMAEDLQLTVGHICLQWVSRQVREEREMRV